MGSGKNTDLALHWENQRFLDEQLSQWRNSKAPWIMALLSHKMTLCIRSNITCIESSYWPALGNFVYSVCTKGYLWLNACNKMHFSASDTVEFLFSMPPFKSIRTSGKWPLSKLYLREDRGRGICSWHSWSEGSTNHFFISLLH